METGKFPTADLLGFNLWVWDLCIMDASDYCTRMEPRNAAVGLQSWADDRLYHISWYHYIFGVPILVCFIPNVSTHRSGDSQLSQAICTGDHRYDAGETGSGGRASRTSGAGGLDCFPGGLGGLGIRFGQQLRVKNDKKHLKSISFLEIEYNYIFYITYFGDQDYWTPPWMDWSQNIKTWWVHEYLICDP